MSEGEQNDLIRCGGDCGIRKKVGNPCGECRCFAGTGGGQNAEICMWGLADNGSLFCVQVDSGLWEDEAGGVHLKRVASVILILGRITEFQSILT